MFLLSVVVAILPILAFEAELDGIWSQHAAHPLYSSWWAASIARYPSSLLRLSHSGNPVIGAYLKITYLIKQDS